MPRRVLNVAPSPDRHRDYPVAQARVQGLLDGTPVPAAVDLRAPVVGDRRPGGDRLVRRLGAGGLRDALAAGRERAPAPRSEPLSPRFLWMAAKEMRAKLGAVSGDPSWRPGTSLERAYTSLKAGLEVARRFGVALEAEVPWRGGLYGGDVDAFFASAARRRVRSYWSLDEPDVAGTVANWREWLNERGPILVKIAVDEALEEGSRDVLGAFDPAHRARPPRRRARRLRPGPLRPAQLLGDGLGGGRLRALGRRLRGRRGGGELRRGDVRRPRSGAACRRGRAAPVGTASRARAPTAARARARGRARAVRAAGDPAPARRCAASRRPRAAPTPARASPPASSIAASKCAAAVRARGRPRRPAARRRGRPGPTPPTGRRSTRSRPRAARAAPAAPRPPRACRRRPRGRRGSPARRASRACAGSPRSRRRGTRRGCGARPPASPRAHSAAATIASHTGRRG